MNRLYFEFPKEELEIFKQLAEKLKNIEIKLNEPESTISLMIFQDVHFTIPKEENNCTLAINISPTIYSRIIYDKNKKRKIDREIDKVYKNITLDDIYESIIGGRR